MRDVAMCLKITHISSLSSIVLFFDFFVFKFEFFPVLPLYLPAVHASIYILFVSVIKWFNTYLNYSIQSYIHLCIDLNSCTYNYNMRWNDRLIDCLICLFI